MGELSPTDHQHQNLKNQTYVLSADGNLLKFGPLEKKFLRTLQDTNDLYLAAQSVGKTEDWAIAFFKRPKIHEWVTKVAQEQAAKNGMTVSWIRSQLFAVVRGKEIWWEGTCSVCNVKNKTWITPEESDGKFSDPCLGCNLPVEMREIERPVKLDRQQMVALQELSARVDPKVERVSHEFSEETFNFKAEE